MAGLGRYPKKGKGSKRQKKKSPTSATVASLNAVKEEKELKAKLAERSARRNKVPVPAPSREVPEESDEASERLAAAEAEVEELKRQLKATRTALSNHQVSLAKKDEHLDLYGDRMVSMAEETKKARQQATKAEKEKKRAVADEKRKANENLVRAEKEKKRVVEEERRTLKKTTQLLKKTSRLRIKGAVKAVSSAKRRAKATKKEAAALKEDAARERKLRSAAYGRARKAERALAHEQEVSMSRLKRIRTAEDSADKLKDHLDEVKHTAD